MKRFYRVAIDKNSHIIFIDLIQHIGELRLLNYILGSMNKQNLTWFYNKTIRDECCKKVNVAESTLNLYLKNLKDYGILESPTRGVYSINKDLINYITDYKEN